MFKAWVGNFGLWGLEFRVNLTGKGIAMPPLRTRSWADLMAAKSSSTVGASATKRGIQSRDLGASVNYGSLCRGPEKGLHVRLCLRVGVYVCVKPFSQGPHVCRFFLPDLQSVVNLKHFSVHLNARDTACHRDCVQRSFQ